MAEEENNNGIGESSSEPQYEQELDAEENTLDFNHKLKDFEIKLEKCQKEKEEYLLGWQRAKADLINYKNDEKRRGEDLKNWLMKTYILTIVPIFDDFEKALKHIPKERSEDEWVKGIMNIKNKFSNIIKEFGVEEIKTVGEKFNPELHEAVGEVESDKEEGIIIEEIEKGYGIDKMVIRPAKVKVSTKKS